jgi:penicillin amidase
LPTLLPHIPDGEIKERLSEWDFGFNIESKEAVWFQRLYINLIIEVFGHDKAIGWRRIIYLCTRGGYSNMIMTLADRVINNEQSVWWQGRDKSELIRKAYEQTASQPDATWGEFNYFHFADRFFGRRRVGRLLGFDSPKQPMPGCAATPFQGHVFQTAKNEQTFAPSYHFIAEMNSRAAWTNMPGGPSESRFSRYYKSDLERWQKGEYKRLHLGEPVDGAAKDRGKDG